MQIKDYLYSLITDQRKGLLASLLKGLLLACSFIYGFIVRILSFSYNHGIFRRYKPKCKVISVGNITWGGTGKTPMIEMLAKLLKEKGHKIAILSRGYKRTENKDKDDQSLDNLGDESYLLTKKLVGIPVLVGRNRITNAKRVIKDHSIDTIILDDGFQHWRIARDLDIVMIDSMNAFGNGHLMPRGILREGFKSLKRAQIFILTKTDLKAGGLSCLKDRLSKINPEALILDSIHKPLGFYNFKNEELPLSFIENKNICLVSSIASPESFEGIVLNLRGKVVIKFCFSDHHKYSDNDIKNIYDNCRRLNIDNIVTTEKDMVKLKSLPNMQDSLSDAVALRIKLEVTQGKVFYDRLLSLYSS